MSMGSSKRWSVVVCEGYHDRAFWKGMLLHQLGCEDLSRQGKARVEDPWLDPVVGGRFGFRSLQGKFIIVVPARGGRSNVKRTVGEFLKKREIKPVDRLVINVDDDAMVGEPSRAGAERTSLIDHIRKIDTGCLVNSKGELELSDGTVVSIVVWNVNSPVTRGVPAQETLERLVCASLASVHPARATTVDAFLASAGHSGGAEAKAHAWSYMAHLWPKSGCEEFYERVWQDDDVARELIKRMEDAWRVAQDLVG